MAVPLRDSPGGFHAIPPAAGRSGLRPARRLPTFRAGGAGFGTRACACRGQRTRRAGQARVRGGDQRGGFSRRHHHAGFGRIRRPRAGHAGRNPDGGIPARPFCRHGTPARQRRPLVPDRADGGNDRHAGGSGGEDPRQVRRMDLRQPVGGGHAHGRGVGAGDRQPDGVRRLRHRGARGKLERLRRAGSQGQDRGDAGQRSRLPRR